MSRDPKRWGHASSGEILVLPGSSKAWLVTMGLGSGARLSALGSQLIVIIVISRILPEEQFGDMMIVFTIFRTISFGIGSGLGSVVLYHVARSNGDRNLDIRLHRTATLISIVISMVLITLTAVLAEPISVLFEKPGIAMWFFHMAPFLLFSTLNTLATGSFDGRSRVNASIVMSELIPNVIRLILIPFVPVLSLPESVIAQIIWISAAIPWLFAILSLFNQRTKGLMRFTWWDLRYAIFFSLNTIASQQLQGIDMVVVGMLFNSKVAAGYAITSRIAALFPFFQQIVLRNFAPRAGGLLSAQNILTLNLELAKLKRWSIASVAGLTGLIIIAAPFILPIFGDYVAVMPVLIALATPTLIRSLFAGNDIILRMSGRAGLSFTISLLSSMLLVLIPLAAYRTFGIYSIAFGMTLSAIILNPLTSRYIAKEGIEIMRLGDIPLVCCGCFAIVAGVYSGEPHLASIISGSGLMAVAGVAAILSVKTMSRI